MISKSDMKRASKSYDCGSSAAQSIIVNDIEIYKRLPEDNSQIEYKNGSVNKTIICKSQELHVSTEQQENLPKAMVQENAVNDGADEQMLSSVEDINKLANKRDEVKFIKGDHQNGDAKIDVGVASNVQFSGMTKDELMKYANDPFWVRLRWIFFIAFWLMWLGMLAGAIFIIMDAPKCAAPEPLPWYKRGLLAKFNSLLFADNGDVNKVQQMTVNGVIYELPSEYTYTLMDHPEVVGKIKNLINYYKNTGINVILDITPNYATRMSRLMQDAMVDETKRTAFIWKESSDVPNNWLSLVNGSAWSQVSAGNYVLSQFGPDLYDLSMNDTIVKRELGSVLRHLIELGVNGIRVKNSKFFILHKNYDDEGPAPESGNYDLTQYGFWTHVHTTFQNGLGDVLYDYMRLVKNESSDVMFTVSEDIIRPDVYRTSSGEFGIDIPMYGRLIHSMSVPNGKHLQKELNNIMKDVGGLQRHWEWVQWDLGSVEEKTIVHPHAISLFVSLLPGIPIIPVTDAGVIHLSDNTDVWKHIAETRSSPSYMHGDFKLFQSDPLLAYARIKSGNPGYFVVFNPDNVAHKGNFTVQGMPEKVTIHSNSDNFVKNYTTTISKSNTLIDELEIPPLATLIFSYVPIKTG